MSAHTRVSTLVPESSSSKYGLISSRTDRMLSSFLSKSAEIALITIERPEPRCSARCAIDPSRVVCGQMNGWTVWVAQIYYFNVTET